MLNLTTSTNPGIATWSTATSGGCTVIPDGGTISGTYDCNVVCEGTVTMTGAVVCKSDLIVLDTLVNALGFNLTVNGSLKGWGTLNFEHDLMAVPQIAQAEVIVNGDVYMNNIQVPQYAFGYTPITVRGSLICGIFNGGGASAGTPGTTVDVGCDLRCIEIYLSGGEGSFGGSLIVYGNCEVSKISCEGGPGIDDNNAGNGGGIQIGGSLTSQSFVLTNGGVGSGNGVGGNAGFGGAVFVGGDMDVYELSANGGECTSLNPAASAGASGNITVNGSVTCQLSINAYGGLRQYFGGAGPGTGSGGAGGEVEIRGALRCNNISVGGGDCVSDLGLGNAGNGGTIRCYSDVVAGQMYASGGPVTGGTSDAGQGGSIIIQGNLVSSDVIQNDGGGVTNSTGSAGSGGEIFVGGSATCGNIRALGGDSIDGSAGNGGVITVKGAAAMKSAAVRGGNCDSGIETATAGSAGQMSFADVLAGELNADGGFRGGATTVAAANPGGNGGVVVVNGNLTASVVEVNGGNCVTDFPCATGGSGGSLFVNGNMTVISKGTRLRGGSSRGLTPGNGGIVQVIGKTDGYVAVDGGDANDSNVGGDAQTNGSAGECTFKGGYVTDLLQLRNGSGPGAPSAGGGVLRLGGSCSIGEIQMTDVPASLIVASNNETILKVSTMIGKQTLNNKATNAASLNISALLTDRLFVAGGDIWYSILGTTIF